MIRTLAQHAGGVLSQTSTAPAATVAIEHDTAIVLAIDGAAPAVRVAS